MNQTYEYLKKYNNSAYVAFLSSKYSRNPLIQALVIRTVNYPDRLALSDQVELSIMASWTLKQAWSKGLDAGTYRK
jgi:hypothetical protein